MAECAKNNKSPLGWAGFH